MLIKITREFTYCIRNILKKYENDINVKVN